MTMRVVPGPAPAPQPGAVLHNVVLTREGRSLVRPPKAAPAATAPARAPTPAANAPVARAPGAEAAAPVDGRSAFERAVREAVAEVRTQAMAEAKTVGHEQGLQEGRQAAREEARQAQEAASTAHEERLRELAALASGFRAQCAERLAASEQDMVALCFEALARVFGQGAATRLGLAALVRQALDELRPREAMAVHLHPADLALLHGDGAMPEELVAANVQWTADERIARGGCVVEGPQGSVDARLETQLHRLACAFAGEPRA